MLTNNYRKYILKDGTVDMCRACHRPGGSIRHIISGCSRRSVEALLRRLDQGPDSEGSTPRYGSHCEEVPVSGALTTGSLDPAPDTGGPLFFIFFNVFLILICLEIFKNVIYMYIIE